jgi:hypothetical protein
MQQVTGEELKEVYQALLASNPDLGNAGFSGAGHFFTCPNGHIYVIGDCGGATVEARCGECGARIGGSGHNVRSDNRVATEFLALVNESA